MSLRTITVAFISLLLSAAPAQAAMPVEPKRCGTISVKSNRYLIKADQMRCKTAKTRSRRYLRNRTRPEGYTCRSYDRSTAMKFRCWKGARVFFAIRR